MVRLSWIVFILLIEVGVGECKDAYQPIPNQARLQISFADPEWNGKDIPVLHRCGAPNPMTPPLIIKHFPEGANAVIMEFNDTQTSGMDDGGHGKIGFRVAGKTDVVVVPPAPAYTFELPEGFFLVARHRSGTGAQGAYAPPCLGWDIPWEVVVKAVFMAPSDNEDSQLLGTGKILLGIF